jgi:hypothetical protein
MMELALDPVAVLPEVKKYTATGTNPTPVTDWLPVDVFVVNEPAKKLAT